MLRHSTAVRLGAVFKWTCNSDPIIFYVTTEMLYQFGKTIAGLFANSDTAQKGSLRDVWHSDCITEDLK